ncbi:MAG: hypothetical protein CL685_03740 [Candidatus Magasanikbacteria bacterium]|nr:hypothetical protein [Candidatus Magasanikbacteria bacterium]
MFNLITIGDCVIDTFLILDDTSKQCAIAKNKKELRLNFGDKIPISASDQSIGGNAANVAVGATKLSCKTAIITELGDDISGHVIKEALHDSGVNTTLAKIQKNKQTRYSVILHFKSERTILSYQAKRQYTLPKIPKADWIYYTSLSKGFEVIQKKLITHLKKNPDISLAINPGSFQMNAGKSVIKHILPFTTLLVVNKEEAQKLVGKKASIYTLAKSLYKKGVKQIIITDSTNGSYSFDGSQFLFMPTYNIKAVARTGAGDAYTSGVLSALIHKKTLAEAMQWGTANASGVIQKVGAQQGLLSLRKTKAMIKKYKKVVPKKIKKY